MHPRGGGGGNDVGYILRLRVDNANIVLRLKLISSN